jgi:hypothetical protein
MEKPRSATRMECERLQETILQIGRRHAPDNGCSHNLMRIVRRVRETGAPITWWCKLCNVEWGHNDG